MPIKKIALITEIKGLKVDPVVTEELKKGSKVFRANRLDYRGA